jgi:diacylglycerol O-acyltransferase / wax synthase
MTASPPVAIDPTPEPMSSVDRAWLEMGGRTNPMVVASIMEFEGVRNPASLARCFTDRLLAQRRFRQRVVEGKDGYAWVEDDEMHLGYHVQLRRLGGAATEAKLQAAVAAELGHSLDRALPLWRICLFVRGKGRVTMLFRAHHAVADGVALMRGFLHMCDGAQPLPAVPRARRANGHHGPLGGLIHRLETANALLENLTEVVVDDLRNPGRLTQQVADARRTFMAISRVFLLPDNNPARLRATPSGQRAVAWTSSLSFPRVRRFAHAQGVTINDVFLAALTGAFGRYLRRFGAVAEGQNLRVSVPVNLRASDDGTPGNGFGLVLADLPVGLEGWHARIDVIAERMALLKQSPEAKAVFASLWAAGHLPPAAERQLVNFIGGKATAVVSNLPGPRQAVTLGGARLANMVFWPPQTAGIGIGVSFLSYAGHVTVGISADTAQIPRPQQLIDDFCAELQDMLGQPPHARAARPRRPARHPSAARPSKGVKHVQA